MTEFKVPELGENVAGGDVMRVMVNVGDTVARDQPVLELETDKATIEVPSTVAGTVKEIRVKKGDKVKVGAVVLTVEEGGVSGNGASKKVAAKPEERAPKPAEDAAAKTDEEAAPKTEAPAAESKPAQEGRADSKILAMPPRAAQEAPPAPAPRADAGPAKAGHSDNPASAFAPGASADKKAGLHGDRGPVAAASPAVRRLAREIGVNVDEVQGSGPAGRISQDDVKEHARRILSSVSSSAGSGGAASAARAVRPLPDFQKWGEVDRQAWSNIRRTTSEHLSYAWNVIPHVTQFDKADVTAIEELRKKFKEQIAKAGGNLTVTAILVKILAIAVKKFPQFNASVDTERGEIIYKKYVNVGVAVDTDRGLLVPVVRNADRKNITEIAIELNQLATKARDRKLSLEEMSGGGISISNLGGIGGTAFTPIVNWPEVAILGVSRASTEPVWTNDSFQPRPMLPLSLSYDHRVIDGADAMRFLRWVAEAIEQPFLLSLLG